MTITIEKGIPLPLGGRFAHIIQKMDVGDSVVVKNTSEYNAVAKALWRQGWSTKSKKIENGRRIWKLKRLNRIRLTQFKSS